MTDRGEQIEDRDAAEGLSSIQVQRRWIGRIVDAPWDAIALVIRHPAMSAFVLAALFSILPILRYLDEAGRCWTAVRDIPAGTQISADDVSQPRSITSRVLCFGLPSPVGGHLRGLAGEGSTISRPNLTPLPSVDREGGYIRVPIDSLGRRLVEFDAGNELSLCHEAVNSDGQAEIQCSLVRIHAMHRASPTVDTSLVWLEPVGSLTANGIGSFFAADTRFVLAHRSGIGRSESGGMN